MNRYLGQAAARTSNGTQDITNATIGTCKFAIAWLTNATANDTNTAGGNFSIGMYDGTTTYNQTMHAADATGGSTVNTWCTSTTNFLGVTGAGGTYTAAATVSFITNGIRINWTTAPGTAMLINVLLLSGSDFECNLSTASFTSATLAENIAVTHAGLTSTLDNLICLTANNAIATGSGTPRFSMGFYDRASNTYATSALRLPNGQNPSQVGSGYFTDCIATQINGAPFTAQAYKVTVGSFTGSGFTMSSSAGANTALMAFACFRFIGSKSTYVGATTLPIATGNFAAIAGMSTDPGVMLAIPSMRTASGSSQSTSAWGLHALVKQADGTTFQGGSVAMHKDAVSANSVEKAQTTASETIKILDNTGAADFQATHVNTTGGVTLNASNVASAYLVPVMAFGIGAATSFSISVDAASVAAAGQSLDGAQAATWTEGQITLTGQDIVMNVSGVNYSVTVPTVSLTLAGQAQTLDQGIPFTNGAVSIAGQAIGLVIGSTINPGTSTAIWGGDLTISKNWQYLSGLGYAGAFRMKTASNGAQIQLSAIDYVFKPGGVL